MSIEQALIEIDRQLLQLWRRLAPETSSLSLTWNEYHYLEALAEGSLRLSELAQKMGVSKASVSTMVRKLEARGLLERLPDPDDRRASRVQLTGVSRQLQAEDRRVYRALCTQLKAGLSTDEFTQLSHLLIKASATLNRDTPAPPES